MRFALYPSLLNILMLIIGLICMTPAHSQERPNTPSNLVPFTQDRDLDTIKIIDSLILAMDVRERIGQTIIVYHSPQSFLKKHAIGGTIIMQNMLKKPDQLRHEISQIQNDFEIGIFTAIDQEGGFVNRLKKLPGYRNTPSAADFTQLSQASKTLWSDSIAHGMRSLGLNLNLAPVVDPAKDVNGQLTLMGHKGRAYGSRYEEIVHSALTFCETLKKHAIACTSKHFPGYDVESNSDHDIAVSSAATSDIIRRSQPFKALNQCAPFMMMSSIMYPQFDGVPSVFSNKMVALARSLAPSSLIMTDDLWGKALRDYIHPEAPQPYPDRSFKRLAQMAFLAGNDLFLITYPRKAIVIQDGLEFLLKRFPNLHYQLHKSLRKILLQKARMGLVKAIN